MQEIKTAEEWHKWRREGIGGSDAAAIMGLSPYKNNNQLWAEKKGLIVPKNIDDKPYVIYGKNIEQHIRGIFALDFPEYDVTYKDYDVCAHPKYPFIRATLDGRLVRVADGAKGALECKKAEIMNGTQLLDWKGRVPDNYFVQNLHQMLAGGFDYTILPVDLIFGKGLNRTHEIRYYLFERRNYLTDLEVLLEAEVKFWEQVTNSNEPPPQKLPVI